MTSDYDCASSYKGIRNVSLWEDVHSSSLYRTLRTEERFLYVWVVS